VDTSAGGRTGYLIEYRPTAEMFNDPKEDRTKEYIRGEFS
jgi:phosphate transport system ATP-binding protein